MGELANPGLAGWESFYVIVGSSGAALIGLQFVVIALIAETSTRVAPGSIRAFGTPTVVHLGGSLVISAIMSAPWPSIFAVSIALAAFAIVGIGFGASVVYHARRQTVYQPVWQDWLWHVILPCCVYGALALAAVSLRTSTRVALFVIAGTALGLLLIALHNAWDSLIFIVLAGPRSNQKNGK